MNKNEGDQPAVTSVGKETEEHQALNTPGEIAQFVESAILRQAHTPDEYELLSKFLQEASM
jgi:hypothetical protein